MVVLDIAHPIKPIDRVRQQTIETRSPTPSSLRDKVPDLGVLLLDARPNTGVGIAGENNEGIGAAVVKDRPDGVENQLRPHVAPNCYGELVVLHGSTIWT